MQCLVRQYPEVLMEGLGGLQMVAAALGTLALLLALTLKGAPRPVPAQGIMSFSHRIILRQASRAAQGCNKMPTACKSKQSGV